MSKRYGRNQKRQQREEITRLKQSYAMTDGLLKRVSNDLQQAKSTIAEMLSIISAVCPHSVAIPAKEERGQEIRNHYRLAQHSAVNFGDVTGGDFSPSAVSFRSIDLYALRVFLDQNRERFQTAVHLEYSGGKHSAYMISDEAMYSIPREILIKRIAPDIARRLVDNLRGK